MPCGTREKYKQREKFKSSEKHQERRSQFGMYTITGIVLYRTDGAKAGPDVADAFVPMS